MFSGVHVKISFYRLFSGVLCLSALCRCRSGVVDCKYRGLSSIPKDIPYNTISLMEAPHSISDIALWDKSKLVVLYACIFPDISCAN